MQVKEAVALAKEYIRDVFSDENISDLGLEEVEFDEGPGIWSVTIGFSRPWATKGAALAGALGPLTKSDYKVLRIRDSNRQVLSVKNREVVTS